jgi:hypothetical protein
MELARSAVVRAATADRFDISRRRSPIRLSRGYDVCRSRRM